MNQIRRQSTCSTAHTAGVHHLRLDSRNFRASRRPVASPKNFAAILRDSDRPDGIQGAKASSASRLGTAMRVTVSRDALSGIDRSASMYIPAHPRAGISLV